jgi:uncharacterized protein with ParB-like and HNH nuclease domain
MSDFQEIIEKSDEDDEIQIEEYELTSSPNDFNVLTIFSFIESKAVKIPGFQRNYVWDIKRASKLVESIIIGLPVPQIFLYEEAKNSFLVIDGQQRLMSIYYFIKQRFPRTEKRTELRRVFDEHGQIPKTVLQNDEYFEKFNLRLADLASGAANKFEGLNYETLEDYKTQFDLRTIRNVIVKQNVPKDDDSSIYEMFNRLNTGGINLTPQEIRASLYHSDFYTMLSRVNMQAPWRKLLDGSQPDLHMRDIEILLRGFAMLLEGDKYGSSMARFLNRFSKNAKAFTDGTVKRLETVFNSFLEATAPLPSRAFFSASGKFSLTTFEAIFAAVCGEALKNGSLNVGRLNPSVVASFRSDSEFAKFSQAQSNRKANVAGRLRRAKELISSGS